jgi:hypothetical protein
MNPLTPPGLPYGDKAALVKIDGMGSSSTAIRLARRWRFPSSFLAMMDAVATAKISHEGSAL